jgi:hypothetical protein
MKHELPLTKLNLLSKGHDQSPEVLWWLQDVASDPTQNATNHEGDCYINWHKPPEEHILQDNQKLKLVEYKTKR